MTPDQIFKAEAKLRELKKLEDALANIGNYVFAADAETVPGTKTPPFPWGKSDLARHLRDDVELRLRERINDLQCEAVEMGVNFSMSEAKIMEVGHTIGKVTP